MKALIIFLVGNQKRYLLLTLYNTFLISIIFSGYKLRIKSDKDPLAVEQTIYVTKIVNAYIVYELNVLDKTSY